MTLYRYIRGEAGDYGSEEFLDNEEACKAEALQWAERDGDDVLLEYQDEDGTWWCTGAAYPPGKEPAPVDLSKRFSATAILPGDRVHVFGAPVGQFGQVRNQDHEGTVLRKHQLTDFHYGFDGWRIEFDDGRIIDCIDHAVTTIHDLDLDPELEAL